MHPLCFTIPTRGALKGVSAEDFVSGHLDDQTSDEILSDETQKQQIIDAIATKPSKNAKNKDGEGGGGATNPISKRLEAIKTKMLSLPPSDEDDDDDGDKKPAAKKAKTSDVVDEDALVVYAKAMKVYSTMKNDDLKSVLRWNLGYGMTGTKDVLLLR